MSKATIELGGDATELESTVKRSQRAIEALAATAKRESDKAAKDAADMSRYLSNSLLKTQSAEAKATGDTDGAARIEREIALQAELHSIQKLSGSDAQKNALASQAIVRARIADEQALAAIEARRVANAAAAVAKTKSDEQALIALRNKGVAEAEAMNAKTIKDEQALLSLEKQRRAELDAINAIARKSATSIREQQRVVGPARVVGAGTVAAVAAPGAAPRGGNGMGMAAMQIQDVAVQAQMGTSASTIAAQQGSQFLSAFGPTGIIAGGILAVGGAFVTMGLASDAAFDKMKSDASEFIDTAGKLEDAMTTGSSMSLYEAAAGRMDALRKEGDEIEGFWNRFSAAIASTVWNGVSSDDKRKENVINLANARQKEASSQKSALEYSADGVKIEQLKADENEREAAAMERSLELKKAIAKIDRSNMDSSTKKQLKDDAIAADKIKGDVANKGFDEKNAKQAQDFIDSIEADEKDAAQKRKTSQEKDVREMQAFEKQQAEEFRKFEAEKIEEIRKEEKRLSDERDAGAKAMTSALTEAQKIEDERLTTAEKMVKAEQEVVKARAQLKAAKGTAGEEHAAANLQQAMNNFAAISLQNVAKFSKSTTDAHKQQRAEVKTQKQRAKAEDRMIEDEVRQADAIARRSGTGLTDEEKAAKRAQGKAALHPMKSTLEEDTKEMRKILESMAKKVGVAK